MRVVIDGYWWSRGTQSLRNAVHGIVTAWAAEFPEDQVTVVTFGKNLPDDVMSLANVTFVRTRVWPQALAAMVVVPLVSRRLRADASFAHNFTPLFGRTRSVLIHDLIFMTNPEWFTKAELFYFRWMVWSARRAEVVFTTTRSEARRVREQTSVSDVAAVGFGLDPAVLGDIEPCSVAGLRPGSFLLTVGRLNVRKNLRSLLEGARLSGHLAPDRPVVVVGEKDGEWEELPHWVREAEAGGSIRFTGFLPREQLVWLLGSCSLYLSLSFDEGFGLPPIEAAALGARVIVSDRPVFRETLDGAATFVDPSDIVAIGDAIHRALEAESEGQRPRSEIASAVRARHRWDRTVRAIRARVAVESRP